MTMPTTDHHTASIVPEDDRERFLPSLFGLRLLIVAENAVYTFMERLSPSDYGGGFWNFYEYAGQPLFMAPTSRPRFRIENQITVRAPARSLINPPRISPTADATRNRNRSNCEACTETPNFSMTKNV